MSEMRLQTLWCDDIRQEIGNKPSFMGVYTGGIVVASLPTVLPRLSVWLTIETPVDAPPKTLSLRIVRDDGEELVRMADAEIGEPERKSGRSTVRLMAGLALPGVQLPEGIKHLQLLATVNGEELQGEPLPVQVNANFLSESGVRVSGADSAGSVD